MFNDSNGANAGDQNNSEGNGFDESKLPKFSEIDPEDATPEQVGEVLKAAQTLLGQSKHWKGKAIDPETGKPYAELYQATRKKEEPSHTKQPSDDLTEQRLSRIEQAEEKRQFGFTHKLSPEETDKLFAFAQGSGQKPIDALKDPFFETGLKAFREKQSASDATLGPSNRRPVFEGKSFKEMSEDDKRKNFAKFTGALQKK